MSFSSLRLQQSFSIVEGSMLNLPCLSCIFTPYRQLEQSLFCSKIRGEDRKVTRRSPLLVHSFEFCLVLKSAFVIKRDKESVKGTLTGKLSSYL